MKNHTDFLDYVMPHVPGATVEMALLEIKNTIIDFCEKSLILQESLDPVAAVQNIMDYDLEPPKDRLVVKIIKAWFKGVELTPVSVDEIHSPSWYNQNADYVVLKQDPTMITQKDTETFSVYPIPGKTEANVMTLRVALKPTRSTNSIDDFVYENYAETIGHGAIARLSLSPDKPYTNPQMAVARNALYMAGLNVARDRANKSNVRVNKSVKMRRI